MTCIVAIAHNGIVHMAGDRGHSDPMMIISSTRPKISEHGPYVFGYAGNSGLGQAVEYCFTFPTPAKTISIDKHMNKVFIPALRTFFKEQDIKLPDNDEESGDFLIGIRGHIYEINTLHMYAVEYDGVAIGSGSPYALGYLQGDLSLPPKERVINAVQSAITYSPLCKGPIDYIAKQDYELAIYPPKWREFIENEAKYTIKWRKYSRIGAKKGLRWGK